MKIDTCVRNASTDLEELDWDAVTISQLQDIAEVVSQKNVQYSYREENVRKHYGRRSYDRAHM